MITDKDEAVTIPEIKADLQKKFEARVQVGEVPDNELCEVETECHYLNRGYERDDGYITVTFSNVRLRYHLKCIRVHILAYLLYIGARFGMQVNHRCNNRWCVNPDHLVLGGPKPNADHASATKQNYTPDQESWKLCKDQRVEIRNLHWLDGWSFECLAEEFDVSTTAIRKVIKTPEPKIQRKEGN